MMLAWEVGPPLSRAIARTRRGSSRAVSAGERSSATRMDPRGRSRWSGGWPPESCRAISRATSVMSADLSRMAEVAEVSSLPAISRETRSKAHSGLTRSRRILSTTAESNVSSEAIMPCASRIAASSELMSPLDCRD